MSQLFKLGSLSPMQKETLRNLQKNLASLDDTVLIGSFVGVSKSKLIDPDQVASIIIETTKDIQNQIPEDEDETQLELSVPSKKTSCCKHQRSCLGNSFRGFGRTFLLGFGIKAFVSFASGVLLQKLYAKPLLLLIQVFGFDTFRFGAFLGCFTAGFKGIQCLLRFYRGCDDKYNSMIAAGIAALSIMFENQERRHTFALYLFVRALDLIYHYLVHTKAIPRFEHRDLAMFSMTTCLIMYAWHFHPNMIHKSFHRFISSRGGISPAQLQGSVAMVDKTNFDWSKWCTSNKIPNYCPGPSDTMVPCSVFHPPMSCNLQALYRLWVGFYSALPVYAPIHLFPLLIFRFKDVIKNPFQSTVNSVVAVSRSALFISSLQAIFWFVFCKVRTFQGRDSRLASIAAGFLSGLSLLIEKKSRRSELMIFTLPKAFEVLWKFGALYRIFPAQVKNGDVFMFMIAMSLMMTFYQHEPEVFKSGYFSLLHKFFGDN